MFTERLQLQLIIGSDTVTGAALDAVRAALARRYGGLTLIQAVGDWAIDGDAFVNTYGAIATEAAYIILITMVPAALDMDYIKRACAPLQGFANWIHVEIQRTQAAHFSLNAMANLTSVQK